jgi:HEAT repeat protein
MKVDTNIRSKTLFGGWRWMSQERHTFLHGLGSVMNLRPRLESEASSADVPATVLQRIEAVQRRFAAASAAAIPLRLDWDSLLQNATSTAAGLREAAAAKLAPGSQGKQNSLTARLLAELARDSEASVRLAALASIARSGLSAVELIASFMENDESEAVRLAALAALKRIGPPSIPALISIAEGSGTSLRQGAVRALGEIGDKRSEVVECLLRRLTDVDMYVRARSVYALGCLRVTQSEVIHGLTHRLGDSEKIVRDAAIHSLAEIGPPAKDALSELLALRVRDASAAPGVDRAIDLIGRGPQR